MRRWMIPAALVALVLAGAGMAIRPELQASSGFLSPLRVGMAVSVTQNEGALAHIYIPSADEAKVGGSFKVTAVGTDFFECQSGSAVWRVPVSSIARISSSAPK